MDIVKHNEIAWDKQSSDAESPLGTTRGLSGG